MLSGNHTSLASLGSSVLSLSLTWLSHFLLFPQILTLLPFDLSVDNLTPYFIEKTEATRKLPDFSATSVYPATFAPTYALPASFHRFTFLLPSQTNSSPVQPTPSHLLKSLQQFSALVPASSVFPLSTRSFPSAYKHAALILIKSINQSNNQSQSHSSH